MEYPQIPDWLKGVVASGIVFIAGWLATKFRWITFTGKDKAAIRKIDSETALIEAQKEKLISQEALGWTAEIGKRLDRAYETIDKVEADNDRLHSVMDVMKEQFDEMVRGYREQIDEMEKGYKKQLAILEQRLNDCDREKDKAQRELEQIKKQLNDRG